MSLGPDILDRLRGISSATVTMVLIKRGIRQTWMRGPRPLLDDGARVVGEAFTARFVPMREDLAQPESYGQPLSFRDAIESVPAGAVLVLDARGTRDAATLGDILVARLKHRGVAAAVTDAAVRDVDAVRAVGLPLFCAGAAAPPSIAALAYAGMDELIGCGGVAVRPRDVIVADSDGVVVIPREMVGEVAEAGAEQERFEGFVAMRVGQGHAVVGLYPPTRTLCSTISIGSRRASLRTGSMNSPGDPLPQSRFVGEQTSEPVNRGESA